MGRYDEIAEACSFIWDLSKNDFKTKYAGSALGVIWAFIQPVITIILYWVVFQYGLRVSLANTEVPYVLWFMSGMIPWFYYSDCLGSGTNCFREYDYLVKKVLFPVQILPVVKLFSCLIVHIVFLLFLFAVSIGYNTIFQVDLALLFYFILCLSLVSLSHIILSSSIVIFFRDFGQIIVIILQIGMWATPILWDYHRVPEHFLWIVECNPLFYIVEGYRSALIGGDGIYPSAFRFWFFWISTGVTLVLSIIVFKRLHRHFADVL